MRKKQLIKIYNMYELNGLTLFDFDFSEVVYYSKNLINRFGTCLHFAIADLLSLNCKTNYIPKLKIEKFIYTILNSKFQKKAIFDKGLNLRQFNKDNCVIVICCNGGYHAIAKFNGKYLNNWKSRDLISYNDLLNEFEYSRAPKVICYLPFNNELYNELYKIPF